MAFNIKYFRHGLSVGQLESAKTMFDARRLAHSAKSAFEFDMAAIVTTGKDGADVSVELIKFDVAA
jgi:hypothetical protein